VAEAAPVFVDSSCLVALAMNEPGAARLRSRIARASARYASTLAEAELMAALAREGLSAFDVPGVDWIAPSRRLTRELERVLSGGYLRGADAWHLACALFLDPDVNQLVFLTLDRRQREVAKAVGFRVA
jgi:predicted nucleic acid-binding protein